MAMKRAPSKKELMEARKHRRRLRRSSRERVPALIIGLNPAFQRTLVFESGFSRGKVNRVTYTHESVGGKGQHAALAMHAWAPDVPIRLAQFIGGDTGDGVLRMLGSRGISQRQCIGVRLVEGTRVCQTLVDCSDGTSDAVLTEVVGPSPHVDASHCYALKKAVVDAGPLDALAICGTAPEGVEEGWMVDLVKHVVDSSVRRPPICLLDGYRGVGALLRSGHVTMVKVNADELAPLARDAEKVMRAEPLDAARLPTNGAREALVPILKQCSQVLGAYPSLLAVGVTRGSKEAVLCIRGGDGSKAADEARALVYSPPPDVKAYRTHRRTILNAIGAGDTCTGVLLAEMIRGTPLPKAFGTSLAAASASLLSLSGAAFDSELVRKFSPSINYHELQFHEDDHEAHGSGQTETLSLGVSLG